jgi:hypothetical protein
MGYGNLDNLFPPGNNGTSHGVGMITGNDGKHYVFQTPSDNDGQVLTLGPISFVVTNGRHIDSVSQSSDGSTGSNPA